MVGMADVLTLLLWVPPNTQVNNTTKVFTITVTHDLSSITGGHIHKGTAGTNGA
jgi:hypothetical protein